jgi:hypothetical protein
MTRATQRYGTVLLLLALAGALACATGASIARRHPEEVSGLPVCADCHENDFAGLDHTAAFAGDHRYAAVQGREQVCSACHAASFCADCHAGKEEIKPGDKIKDQPWRSSPTGATT